MRTLIPEKTIEIFAACSVLDVLGPATWIWSPAKHEDQVIWDPSLRKWLMLELKAPLIPSSLSVGDRLPQPRYEIRLKQLDKYVQGYWGREHPDVLYVLPHPWSAGYRGNYTADATYAHPVLRRSFAAWSYVIRASRLQQALSYRGTSGSVHLQCHSLGTTARFFDPQFAAGRNRSSRAVRFLELLLQIDYCNEPHGVALRSASLPPRPPRPDDVQTDDVDLILTPETFARALRALEDDEYEQIMCVGKA